ncbi:TetR/AcrR family transcriptional regulator C-terminal domain-containing protein [Nocardioides flavescens]|uniref:TetR family transcriptional regulator n=1 Tax=Nocardioides flavescens TaxID=2691959 RepID=A0A6L7F403_9ACTN|nr:TetR/AcrR family transcriptional regulator C-terminal domain-containing protein [Nocardioides flavescens]MXG91999.1 TetR family transcriptional regulator [Nocardioides flavescens]
MADPTDPAATPPDDAEQDDAEQDDVNERTDDPQVPDVDAELVAGRSKPSQRVPLDRERIVREALAFLEEVGPGGLTMRRLGQRLGVEAMSLYRYVPGKEDLLDAVVEALVGGIYADPDVLDSPRNGWQDFLQRLAHGVRRVALSHVKAFPLVASRPPEAPWLRPPLRSLDWVEIFLSGLKEEGFSDAAAVAAYRSFTSFLLGSLLLEVASHGADIGPLDVMDDGSDEDPRLLEHPTVRSLRSDLAEDHAAEEFEESLESLLERISTMKLELA